MLTTAALRRHLPLAVLLLLTACVYLFAITRNGTANQFYAASVWAGSQSWKALLFGSLDPANAITVDKPPLSIWVMGLSARLFGFSSASMLVPQALMCVAAVALLHSAVRRLAGAPAGLIAGAVLALTPAAALMFRFNNPDAAMVLLMIAAAYCTVRALDGRAGRWLALAGIALGLAFLAKMLEGLLVLPALAVVYLVAARDGWARKAVNLSVAAAVMVVSAGWYVALTMLWPSTSRPYLAGSTNNTFMNLVLGYNGFGRVLGQSHGGAPDVHSATHMAGDATRVAHMGFGAPRGITRLFSGEWGLEISFLLPAALVALVAIMWLRWREPQTDPVRAGGILFGAWTLIDGLLLAEMKQAGHPYYSLSVAPGIAGLVGIGAWTAWQRRRDTAGLVSLLALTLAAGGWSFVLLAQNDGAARWMRWVVLAATAAALAAVGLTRVDAVQHRLAVPAWCLIALAAFAGPGVYVYAALSHVEEGGSPVVSTSGMPSFHQASSTTKTAELLHATDTTWAAATDGSSAAASLELAARRPVMAVGGFTGQDPSPTLAQFRDDVQHGEVRYFVLGQQRGPGALPADLPESRSGIAADQEGTPAQQVTRWVEQNFRKEKVGSATVYDLTKPVGGRH